MYCIPINISLDTYHSDIRHSIIFTNPRTAILDAEVPVLITLATYRKKQHSHRTVIELKDWHQIVQQHDQKAEKKLCSWLITPRINHLSTILIT